MRKIEMGNGIDTDSEQVLINNFYSKKIYKKQNLAGANRDNQVSFFLSPGSLNFILILKGARRLLLSLKNAIQKAFEGGHLYQVFCVTFVCWHFLCGAIYRIKSCLLNKNCINFKNKQN